jgi:hypothetical protein
LTGLDSENKIKQEVDGCACRNFGRPIVLVMWRARKQFMLEARA